jgi:lactoylglutathione lyase
VKVATPNAPSAKRVAHDSAKASESIYREERRSAGPYTQTMALIHTCYRITDIDRSVAFYEALGFQEVGRLPIKDEAVNVFMNQPGDGDMPRLELTYNYGVDSYEIGSGYGHIAITAGDLDGALARLAEQGIQPEKPPYSVREGGSRLCFVRDPDGYRIEIIEQA